MRSCAAFCLSSFEPALLQLDLNPLLKPTSGIVSTLDQASAAPLLLFWDIDIILCARAGRSGALRCPQDVPGSWVTVQAGSGQATSLRARAERSVE